MTLIKIFFDGRTEKDNIVEIEEKKYMSGNEMRWAYVVKKNGKEIYSVDAGEKKAIVTYEDEKYEIEGDEIDEKIIKGEKE